jgi:bifunctional DNA-binding transcriptional regulator/antitoxin component of YhaV-PrlF toxin-antitoxin module
MVYDVRPYTIQIRQRGQLTLPRKVRESLSISDGDTLTLLPVGDTLVIAPRALRSAELIDRLAEMLEESELSLADMLADLPRIREDIYRQRYSADNEE